MNIQMQLHIKDLRERLEKLEQWVKDFEEWPKPDPELVAAGEAIVKRGPGRPRKNPIG